ncbi:AAA family ATPase [Romeria aff. gracilis LEGE 07310]|uniref:histidine kinase n=1 Tax=Vasconcelosia minhoensis LEGE 07310 TaxID=915328 RepID=A0A8J7AS60_9CYAN|nr:AAA family ATPase [Romeria gracilis]MBE9079681.1 AAA family ATPase [Romeria aff. gracilis LEGE 07310]
MTLSANIDSNLPQIPGYSGLEQLYWGSRTAVYRAVQTAQQRRVVIKLLRQDYPSFSELVQFRNQYTITKNLDIPGIVRPLSLEPYGNGYALVTEDLGSISLAQYARANPLSLPEVFAIAIQLADILHDLGQHHVVHKDIKPANILIQPETGRVLLNDFSIASLLPKETQEVQNPGGLEGTLAYLAPEQTGRMNRRIDYRADFYALGVTLYQLLTGQLPFQTDDPLELVHCHMAQAPMPPDQINPAIPPMASAIVLKLMAKNAENRYQSALGLKHDLEQCLSQWQTAGAIRASHKQAIADFELGQRDLSDRFMIPEKLYGREAEVQTLLAAFDRAAQGSAEVMLVAGFSGIGKTAVVNEVHKPITRQQGYFIKGKFDQFNRNIPFSAFVQALRDLLAQLLAESDARLTEWRAQLQAAVGENGQVLIEVIPELERLIGPQPPAPALSGSAAQHRFNLLFQKFIAVFTTPAHPLVMFLDDLQWADPASLQLLRLLLEDSGYLLLLGAYRDNEVSPAHPFMLAVEDLKLAGATVETLPLAPLAFEDTNRLLADALHCSMARSRPLTELVHRKTQGNPFFTTQFLKTLHEDGYIAFNRAQGYWECDMAQVNAMSLTGDVVELMAQQLQKLPDAAQQAVQLAACIGNQFDLATLAIVSEQSQSATATALWSALQEGLLLTTSQTYKFFQAEAVPADSDDAAELTYRFLHDQVQQVAYSLIPDGQKQSTHLKIGQQLLNHLSEQERYERLFDIVNHLNLGQSLLSSSEQRYQLARLNLTAGKRAKEAGAYPSAAVYLNAGLAQLLPEDWQGQYALTLSLYQEAAETACLNGEFDRVEALARIGLEHTSELLDQVKIHEIRIQAYAAQSLQQQAIDTALQFLAQLGISFSPQQQAEIRQQSTALIDSLMASSGESLVAHGPMTNPDQLAAMRLISSAASAAYQANPDLFVSLVLKKVLLSFKHGCAPSSAFSYADYGVTLCGISGEIEQGYQFGQLALRLLAESSQQELEASTRFIVSANIRHWKEPLRETLAALKQAYLQGLETGELRFACLAANFYCYYAYLSGIHLPQVEKEFSVYSPLIAKIQQKNISNHQTIFHRAVLFLMGELMGEQGLEAYASDLESTVQTCLATGDRTAVFYYYLNQLILFYIFGAPESALQAANLAQPYQNGVTAKYVVPLFTFYQALAQAAVCSGTDAAEPQLAAIQTGRTKLQRWAEHSPSNYRHKLSLIEAEYFRLVGQRAEAIEAYDRAIAAANASAFIQEEALANELAAKFYLDWDKEKVAAGYLQEAYYGYARWGARAKTDELASRYPKLLRPILEPAAQSPNLLVESLSYIASPHLSIHSSVTANRSSSTDANTALDISAVLRAAQLFSSTIQLDQLLRQLTQIILQNSGGDRCAIIMPNLEGIWQVEAMATPETVEVYSECLEGNANLPVKLIQYVKNFKEVVVVDDLSTDLPVIDAYLSEFQPQSLLCLPILNQGQLIGTLYVENRSASGVFNRDRILILNFLCTQAAISLENARLFAQEQRKSHQLEQSQQRLKLLIQQSPVAIMEWNTDFEIQSWNPAAERVFGYRAEEVLGQHFRCIVPEEYHAYVDGIASEILTQRGGAHAINENVRKDRRRIVCEWFNGPMFTPGGEISGGVSMVSDISARKAAEAEVQQKSQELEHALQEIDQSQQLLRKIIDTIPQVVFWKDRDSTYVGCNQNFATMAGIISPDDIAGKTDYDLPWSREESDSFREYDRQVMESKQAELHIVETQQQLDGTTLWLDTSKIPLCDENGEVYGILGSYEDISERKRTEETILQKSQELEQTLAELQKTQLQMVQNEKMASLGNLVAGIAHEINNPIGFLNGSITNAQDYVRDLLTQLSLYQQHHPSSAAAVQDNAEDIDLEFLSADFPKLLQSMERATERIISISNSLRTFSRADTEYKVSADLHEGLDSTLLILKYRIKANDQRPAIEIIRDYGELLPIECFPGQLNQVFMNILANAIDLFDEAAQQGSWDELEANPQTITIQTAVLTEQNWVEICIRDNGRGMTEAVRTRIFDHLFTTKEVGKGTGLGLAIARQIVVETHSGSIDVQSELGQGTAFYIRIPISTEDRTMANYV